MAEPGTPKNLLILIADEHRKDAMGCAGHPIVKNVQSRCFGCKGEPFGKCLYTISNVCSESGQYFYEVKRITQGQLYRG